MENLLQKLFRKKEKPILTEATLEDKEREKIIYEHKKNQEVYYFDYRGRTVLVESNFIADMGFAGYVKTSIGFLVGKPKQFDKQKGKYISILETLLENEKEELREILNS